MGKKVIEPVAITGIGLISSLGISTDLCWKEMLNGRSGISEIVSSDGMIQLGGKLPDAFFEYEKSRIKKRAFKQTAPVTRLAQLCTDNALEDADIDMGILNKPRCGIIMGSSGASTAGTGNTSTGTVDRFKIVKEMANALTAWSSIKYGFLGPSFMTSGAYSSSAYAIAAVCDYIQSGTMDFAVTGGAEMLVGDIHFSWGNKSGLLSQNTQNPAKAMRPFDLLRDGWVLGDGGCALVLESYRHALSRNAKVYGWIRGHGMATCKPQFDQEEKNNATFVHAMETAIENAALTEQDVDYICASGTSSIWEDQLETEAIKSVFQARSNDLLVSAPKSMIGHTVGASSAISVAITALSLKDQVVVPTINLETSDAGCDLHYVPNEKLEVSDLSVGLSNSFGLGGHETCFTITKDPVFIE